MNSIHLKLHLGGALRCLLGLMVLVLSGHVSDAQAADTPLIPVGVAQIDITPDYPVRLSGFGFRRAESEGITERIWAKALAFGNENDGPVILIAADNLCVPDEITQEIVRRLAPKTGLKRERLSITATHTHTAPMLKNVCPTLFGVPIPPEHQVNIDRYTAEFIDKLESVALAAVKDIRPARISYGIGNVGFAMNRRTKGGPVDHDMPLLAVHDRDGKLRAVYFNYACHCVTLADNKISGDWAGFAQKAVQELFPGAVALASIGCAADSNPSTRNTVEICQEQGQQIAVEVKRLLTGKLTPITVPPTPKYSRVEIPFDTPRTRAEWEERAKLEDAVGHHARVTLAKLDRGEALPKFMDYPVQSWTFGDELAIVFLPGETVVDYALRLKREFDRSRLWVNGYSNEGRCYLPSERILREGGYEGGGAMIYYDFPQRFAPGLEDKIVGAVTAQLPASFKAAPGTEGVRPLEPKDALRSFRTKPGLVVELVAAEPLVQDPVAMDWGPDGKLWVCEMHDYPSGTDNNWQPGGRVKFLDDRDGDGSYEHAVVFADRIPFPTGVMAWNGGVLICAAPDILFARDENGDGKADKIEKVFTGFATDNYQARVNSLMLGLDNWIYAANGLLGGTIRTERNSLLPGGSAGATLDIRGRDIRFSPKSGALETVTGLTQYGRTRDDFGNWFGCDNTRLLLHFPRSERYMRRNPHVVPPNSIHLTTSGADASKLYPTSRLLERFNDHDYANRVTSAGGIGFYRDTLLGEEYYGNAFTCEAVHNLVHREVLSGDLIFSSKRAPDERDSEFLSSSDNWFRPTQARTGPDGALYVVDIYRFLIEHPRWIPAERLAQIDIRAGSDRGRIYRLRKKDGTLRPIRDLTKLESADLAAALDSPNGTERDRVHAELFVRPDKSAAPVLMKLAREAQLPQVRLQALAALDGIEMINLGVLKGALSDEHPAVREHALRLAEPILRNKPPTDLMQTIFALTGDESIRVQRQLAYTLGEISDIRAGEVLAQMATKHFSNAEMRAAVLSSALPHCGELFEAVSKVPLDAPDREAWVGGLVATAAGSKNAALLSRALAISLPPAIGALNEAQLSTLARLLSAVGEDDSLRKRILPSGSEEKRRLEDVLTTARETTRDLNSPESLRGAAIQLIGAAGEEKDLALIAEVASGGSEKLRRMAISALRQERSAAVAKHVLAHWEQSPPGARAELTSLLLDRAEWTTAFLEAVKNGVVQANTVSLSDRQRLARSENAGIRQLSAELLPEQSTSSRVEVLNEYKAALALSGDASRGAKVFAEQCASCHALKGVGHNVGPDLAALRNKDAEYWLKSILDPNAVIEPRFVSYQIDLADDRAVNGIIKDETATSLTLISGNGVMENVFRSKIKKLRASSLSLMPEGLEQTVPPQQMADLIAYVRDIASEKSVPSATIATTKSDAVLRDPASVARFILDATKTQAARETAVQANPQFAAALITEMTRDLAVGTPEEYVRIPWIWRVAIACGRRNDAGQLRGLLAASLPQLTEPLRDWQAVVIGGGIINGLSERGFAPGERVKEIIGRDSSLLKRWQHALDLASTMTDNKKVPNGTRYDALRMIGVEPWEKRGRQLVRYLGKEVNSELQMGAVSGLADMRSARADRALLQALPQLTERNRKLALDALAKSGKLPESLSDEKQSAELLKN